ncbi:MAG: 3,4-dihydroxy-2-butanone-4-phosphate synthase [Candidatus Thermoplasmatota archaeon]
MYSKKIKKAISDLKKGKFILIHDDKKRENETDLVIQSKFVNSRSIKKLRKDGGGLIFLMISNDIAKRLQLPYLSNVFSYAKNKYPVFKKTNSNDIPYDDKSSFSIYVNHKDTYTGITDIDRSKTMNKFAEMIEETKGKTTKENIENFGKNFRTPGHIPICIAAEKLLNERKGHTELVVSLLKIADLTPVGSGCEMIGDNGKALPPKKAKKYAEKNNITYLEGEEIIKAWKKWSK